jgi:hypothetical protein
VLATVALVAMLAPQAASAAIFPDDPDIDTVVIGNTVIVHAEDESHVHRFTFQVSAKLSPQSATIRFDDVTHNYIVDITLGGQVVISIPESEFVENDDDALAAAKALPPPIAIANDADTIDVACDAKTAVVAGANSATPVALVDLAARQQLGTASYAGKLARAVAVDDDGTQALVVIDDANLSVAGEIRRLAIGAGTLTDTGERLAFANEYVWRVFMAPGAKVGVAIVGNGPTRLVSFSVPGLAPLGSLPLTGTGNALVFSPSGDQVWVRSGQRAVSDAVERHAFDPHTGTIGQAANLTVSGVSGFTGVGFQKSMAITPDGTTLVIGDENTGGTLPAPRIAWYSASTGALLRSEDLPAGSQPRIVSTLRACTVMALTEYHHAAFDHYFVTGIANEIALLDNGTLAGWARTGKTFNVYRSGTPGTAPTCRFFSDSFAPKSSHFYTPFASECDTVKANPRWTFEGEVFNVALPGADGSCLPPTVPLYRLYNDGQGGAPNHRYTTELDVRQAMMAQGWVPEGSGIGVIACVPP